MKTRNVGIAGLAVMLTLGLTVQTADAQNWRDNFRNRINQRLNYGGWGFCRQNQQAAIATDINSSLVQANIALATGINAAQISQQEEMHLRAELNGIHDDFQQYAATGGLRVNEIQALQARIQNFNTNVVAASANGLNRY